MSVGVIKDYKLKQRNLRASRTLGCKEGGFFFPLLSRGDERNLKMKEGVKIASETLRLRIGGVPEHFNAVRPPNFRRRSCKMSMFDVL
jgi:hypothetical protein